jgi:hypothetical protein
MSSAKRHIIDYSPLLFINLRLILTAAQKEINIRLSVATQKSGQFVNKTFVTRFKGRVRPAFFMAHLQPDISFLALF